MRKVIGYILPLLTACLFLLCMMPVEAKAYTQGDDQERLGSSPPFVKIEFDDTVSTTQTKTLDGVTYTYQLGKLTATKNGVTTICGEHTRIRGDILTNGSTVFYIGIDFRPPGTFIYKKKLDGTYGSPTVCYLPNEVELQGYYNGCFYYQEDVDCIHEPGAIYRSPLVKLNTKTKGTKVVVKTAGDRDSCLPIAGGRYYVIQCTGDKVDASFEERFPSKMIVFDAETQKVTTVSNASYKPVKSGSYIYSAEYATPVTASNFLKARKFAVYSFKINGSDKIYRTPTLKVYQWSRIRKITSKYIEYYDETGTLVHKTYSKG